VIARALVLALCAHPALAQDEDAPQLRGSEGPLDNAAFLPVHEAANAALARADSRIATAGLLTRQIDASGERAWTEVFDDWHSALRDSRAGEMVAPEPRDGALARPSPWPDADGTSDAKLDRRRDGVEAAVLRRLAAIAPQARALWRARFEPLAEQRLQRAGNDVAELATIERIFPATLTAARAAIRLSDVELERARPDAASTWIERARAHAARLDGNGTSLEPALASRAQAIERELSASIPSDESALWRTATHIAPVSEVLIDEGAAHYPHAAFDPGLGLRAGMCFLDGGKARSRFRRSSSARASIKSGWCWSSSRAARASRSPLRRNCSSPSACNPPNGSGPIEPPGWPLLPASDGRAIVTTIGRCDAAQLLPNSLACVEFEGNAASATTPTLDLRWAWYGGKRVAGPGASESEPLEGATFEFQPGPLLRGGDVFALVREFVAPPKKDAPALADAGSEIKSSVVALDLATGALRWKCELGKGVEIQRGRMRLFAGGIPPTSAQPLAWIRGRLFAGTDTGFATLLDAVDGRVAWGFRCRRRDPERRTWTGARPPVAPDETTLVWGAPDSDHLYWLRGEPDLDGEGILRRAPRRAREARSWSPATATKWSC
jgi:outer membrane protein assembly factor BamB